MTVTLHLKPEVEAGLIGRAAASGMGLEEYLLWVVEEAALAQSCTILPVRQEKEDAVRRMLEFGEKHHLSSGEPITRKFLHEDHRY